MLSSSSYGTLTRNLLAVEALGTTAEARYNSAALYMRLGEKPLDSSTTIVSSLERRERRPVKAEKKWSWTEEGTNSRRKKAEAAAEVAAESMRAFVVVLEEEEEVAASLMTEEAICGVLCLYKLKALQENCNETVTD